MNETFFKTKKQAFKKNQEYKYEMLDNPKSKCKICDRKHNLTIDDIIPRSFLKDLGIDIDRYFNPDNLQILCRSCNQMKSSHFYFGNPKTKELLVEFLKKV